MEAWRHRQWSARVFTGRISEKLGKGITKSNHQTPGDQLEARKKQNKPAAARNLTPPFPFPPPGESRGGEGSPHAATRIAPANGAGTLRAAAPPARGISKRSAEIPL